MDYFASCVCHSDVKCPWDDPTRYGGHTCESEVAIWPCLPRRHNNLFGITVETRWACTSSTTSPIRRRSPTQTPEMLVLYDVYDVIHYIGHIIRLSELEVAIETFDALQDLGEPRNVTELDLSFTFGTLPTDSFRTSLLSPIQSTKSFIRISHNRLTVCSTERKLWWKRYKRD